MKKLLLVAVVAMGIVHEEHAMVGENGEPQQCIEIAKRKIIKLNAPNFSVEAQIKYDDVLKKNEQCLVNFDERVDKNNRISQLMYKLAKENLDESKNKVKEKFGQDIFLAPSNDLDVRNMNRRYASLSFVNEQFSAEAALIENKRKHIEKQINSFKKPETHEKFFKLFRCEKLRNMPSTDIIREIYKEKMNRE